MTCRLSLSSSSAPAASFCLSSSRDPSKLPRGRKKEAAKQSGKAAKQQARPAFPLPTAAYLPLLRSRPIVVSESRPSQSNLESSPVQSIPVRSRHRTAPQRAVSCSALPVRCASPRIALDRQERKNQGGEERPTVRALLVGSEGSAVVQHPLHTKAVAQVSSRT